MLRISVIMAVLSFEEGHCLQEGHPNKMSEEGHKTWMISQHYLHIFIAYLKEYFTRGEGIYTFI